MEELMNFGALVRCRRGGEEGLAVNTGARSWTFRASAAIAHSGVGWRELEVLEVLAEGEEL